MENIKIYHSYGKSPIVAAICFVIAALYELIAWFLNWGSIRWTPLIIGLFCLGL